MQASCTSDSDLKEEALENEAPNTASTTSDWRRKPNNTSEPLQELKEKALKELETVSSAKELQDLKVLYLGKKGPIQELMMGMKDLSKEERPAFGQAVNEVKSFLEQKMEEARKVIEEKELALRLENEKIDITFSFYNIN